MPAFSGACTLEESWQVSVIEPPATSSHELLAQPNTPLVALSAVIKLNKLQQTCRMRRCFYQLRTVLPRYSKRQKLAPIVAVQYDHRWHIQPCSISVCLQLVQWSQLYHIVLPRVSKSSFSCIRGRVPASELQFLEVT